MVVTSTFAQYKIGVKTDDWIKFIVTVSGAISGTPPTWMKVEFLLVEGSYATIRSTMHMADGTEQVEITTINIMMGSGSFFYVQGLVIPANSTMGNAVFIIGYGSVTIASENTRKYAGASRTVVYGNLSQAGYSATYYWDKVTGILVESSQSFGGITLILKATETNMWQGQSFELIFYGLIIAVIAIVVAFILIQRKKKPAEEAPPTET